VKGANCRAKLIFRGHPSFHSCGPIHPLFLSSPPPPPSPSGRHPDVEHVLLSNLYGLPVLRASSPRAETPPEPLETIFATLFAMTAEQCDKAATAASASASGTASSSSSSAAPPAASQAPRARAVVASHAGHLLVQAALHPLVLGVVARAEADPDALLAACPALLRALEPVRLRAEELTGGGG
jgi:hypothetical protein